MNQRNEYINLKKNIECLLASDYVQNFIFIIVNLIFFSKLSIPSSLNTYFKTPIETTVTDGVAIFTVLVLAIGVLYHAGFYKERMKEYRFTNVPYNFLEKTTIIGSMLIATIIFSFVLSEPFKTISLLTYLQSIFIFVIILSVISYVFKREVSWTNHFAIYIAIYAIIFFIIEVFNEQILLTYILTISLLVIGLGYLTEKNRPKINNITLVMIISNEQINNLELFEITDIDYRFKNSEGKELIVPIGQVQKIIYEKIN